MVVYVCVSLIIDWHRLQLSGRRCRSAEPLRPGAGLAAADDQQPGGRRGRVAGDDGR